MKAAVQDGAFRADPFYRLNVLPIHLLPLRERPEDIPYLVDYYVEEYSTEFQRPIRLQANANRLFYRYSWPGNVRELKLLLKRVLLLTEKPVLDASDF